MTKKVILLGDSMIDTFDFMGTNFPELRREFKKINPDFDIELKNHGVGNTDVELALKRISEDYDYRARGRKLLSVIAEKPDLVMIESFAYNHWTEEKFNLQKYVDCHRNIIKKLQVNTKALILLLATIAPSKNKYATGVISLDWDKKKRLNEVNLIMKYMETFLNFARKSGLPILDLFNPTIKNGTGNLKYISNVDYIHLSSEGRNFISQRLAPRIVELLRR